MEIPVITEEHCIGVEFFRKLLLSRNHLNLWSGDACETQPVPALNDLHWLDDCVADPGVQMKSREDPAVHPSLNGKPRSTVRRRIQIQYRRPNGVLKPVDQRKLRRILKHVADDLIGLDFGCCRNPLHCQIDIDRRAHRPEAKFQSIAALQHPRSRVDPKQSRQKPIKRHLTSKAIYLHLFSFGSLVQTEFEGSSECLRRCVLSGHYATCRRRSWNTL
jgi:hypothetical protein